jgi:general secretion pathway protein F
MRFAIRAFEPGAGPISLLIEADSPEAAADLTRRKGLTVLSIQSTWRRRLLRRRQPAFDVLLLSQELGSLLEAGLSLIESLTALSRKGGETGKRQLIDQLIRHLREGKSFSNALSEFPDEFPPVYRALVAASEQTGDLASALARFIEYRGRLDLLRKKITTAAIYPALLIGVGGLVVLFLMTYVVPRFALVYEDIGGNLPFMSRLLLEWGRFLAANGLFVLIAVAIAGTLGTAWFKKRKIRWQNVLRRVLDWKLLAPLRERWEIYALARFYRTTGLLLQGGIPAITSLGMARELLSAALRPDLDRALQAIRAGQALSVALTAHRLAPPVASDLMRIGEKTGEMGEKMLRIADFHDEETARWSEWFVRLFEPLLMLLIGLFIAFIVVLLYMPIFELSGSLQ